MQSRGRERPQCCSSPSTSGASCVDLRNLMQWNPPPERHLFSAPVVNIVTGSHKRRFGRPSGAHGGRLPLVGFGQPAAAAHGRRDPDRDRAVGCGRHIGPRPGRPDCPRNRPGGLVCDGARARRPGRRRLEERVQYRTSRLVAGPLLRTLARPRITGAEHIPATGPAIVASNHLSVVDSIFLPFMLERTLVFAAKSEYFTGTRLQDRAIAAYLRATNQLSVDRTEARAAQDMLESALDLLRAGELFGIYPEGTRSPDGRLYRGRSGVGWLALNSGAPVIPVAMVGTERILPPGHRIPRPGRISIRVGEPLTFEGLQGARAQQRRVVTDEVIQAIQKLSGQEYVPMYASVRKDELAAERSARKS